MRKRVAALVLLLAFLAGLAGCAAGAEENTDALSVYFPTASDGKDTSQAFGTESVTPDAGGTASDTIDLLLDTLLRGPDSTDLFSPFPENVRVLGWTLDKGLLHVDMSNAYGNLAGINLTLADYSVTMTLCQVAGVEKVYITAAGLPIPYRNRQVLSPDDVLLTDKEEQSVEVSAVLYFPRSDGTGLGYELRNILKTEDETLAEAVVKALMDGPESGGFYALVPSTATLLEAKVADEVCYVNFSQQFVDDAPPTAAEQRLLLQSVVRTLCELENVTAVQLLVEGKIPPTYGGLDTSVPRAASDWD